LRENPIATSVFPVIAGVVDLGMSPHEEVAAARVHCEDGPVFVEGRLGEAAQAALREAGFEVRQFPGNYVPKSGRNQLIVIDREGITGASDPNTRRWGGGVQRSVAHRPRSAGCRWTGSCRRG